MADIFHRKPLNGADRISVEMRLGSNNTGSLLQLQSSLAILDLGRINLLRMLPGRRGGKLLREISDLFLNWGPFCLEEISKAASREDRDVLLKVNYRLLDGSAQIGASCLVECCKRIQNCAERGNWSQLREITGELRPQFEAFGKELLKEYKRSFPLSQNGRHEICSKDKRTSRSRDGDGPRSETLIVEPDPIARLVLRQILTVNGHAVTACENASLAIAAFNRRFFPLVFFDLRLPKMNGLDFCHWLRAQTFADHVYAIATTALPEHEEFERVLHAGADDYVSKPFEQASLKIRIRIAENQIADIAQKKKLENQLKREKEFASLVLETTGALIVTLSPNLKIVRTNQTCKDVLSQSEERVLGSFFWDSFLAKPHRKSAREKLEQLLLDPGAVAFEGPVMVRDGAVRYLSWSCSGVTDPSGHLEHIVCTGMDITERHEAQEKMTFLAERDFLTGLYNRLRLIPYVQTAVEQAQEGKSAALIYIDLDNFKNINDFMGGHNSGDEVLVRVAKALRKAAGEDVPVFRCGGDEFVILLSNISVNAARSVGARVISHLERIVHRHQGKSVRIGASIGITPINGDSSADQILSRADAACYRAKSQGRHCVEIHSSESPVPPVSEDISEKQSEENHNPLLNN